jgi:hypothetical protein
MTTSGSVFLDRAVPDKVQSALAWPDNLQSHFFRPLPERPTFVDMAENPMIIDDEGHVRRAWVFGVDNAPGPVAGCGYKVDSHGHMQVHLTRPTWTWTWTVQLGYDSSGESDALVEVGGGQRTIHLSPGRHDLFFVFGVAQNSDTMDLTVADPSVRVCVDKVAVGNPGARP